MRKLSSTTAGKAAVYTSSGVYSSPTFMADMLAAAVRLVETFTRLTVIRSGLLLPYGDWTVSLPWQIRQVRRDMALRDEHAERTVGGGALLAEIGDISGLDALVLIGHSGGGVAAVRAAALLAKQRPELDMAVAQIGCPRFAIPEELRTRVHYMYAVGKSGRIAKDPICRIGSWGGWELNDLGIPRWNPLKCAPGKRTPVRIIGGHADYFRARDPFRHEDGRSNLDIVSAAVLEGMVGHSTHK